MKKICNYKSSILFAGVITFVSFLFPIWVCSQDQGVALARPGVVQQEITPFVPLNQNLVVDPVRGDVVLLFPPEKISGPIRPEHVEAVTEIRVPRRTHMGTDIGTVTGTVTHKTE